MKIVIVFTFAMLMFIGCDSVKPSCPIIESQILEIQSWVPPAYDAYGNIIGARPDGTPVLLLRNDDTAVLIDTRFVVWCQDASGTPEIYFCSARYRGSWIRCASSSEDKFEISGIQSWEDLPDSLGETVGGFVAHYDPSDEAIRGYGWMLVYSPCNPAGGDTLKNYFTLVREGR